VLLSERGITPGSWETIGEVLCDCETVSDFLEVLQRALFSGILLTRGLWTVQWGQPR